MNHLANREGLHLELLEDEVFRMRDRVRSLEMQLKIAEIEQKHAAMKTPEMAGAVATMARKGGYGGILGFDYKAGQDEDKEFSAPRNLRSDHGESLGFDGMENENAPPDKPKP